MINNNDTKEEHEKIMKLIAEWVQSGAFNEESFEDWMEGRIAV